VSAAVCQALAAKPSNIERRAASFVLVERLRIEFRCECLDALLLFDGHARGAVDLSDGESSRYFSLISAISFAARLACSTVTSAARTTSRTRRRRH
jgi:hypothetical protein